MNVRPKVLIAVAALALTAFVAYRETSGMCGPAKTDAHGHGHGHGEEDAGHSSEGFGTKVCEDGFMTALWETLIPSSAPVATKAEAKSDPHAKGDGHAHDKVAVKDERGHADAKEGMSKGKDEHGHGGEGETSEGLVKLSQEQIKAAGIQMAPAASGKLSKEIAAPGRVVMNANANARVVPKLTGTVATIDKQLGETVATGDLLATIESREMADAKAEFLAASRAEELARSTLQREERLWKQKVTAEQEYLAARNAHAEAKIKVDVAHQRLHTIGLADDEIAGLTKLGDDSRFRIYQLRAPIAGQIAARDLVLGQTVGTDKEVFVIADPAKVWVELAVSPNDLSFARQGQDVRIRSGTRQADAKIIALSPIIDPETRSAKAIAEVDNTAGLWRAGDYVEGRLIADAQDVDIVVPRDAIQTVKGGKVVFVNEAGGFRIRPISIGREDSLNAEIVSGLEFGETIATTNTFTLKAELGKAEAEHEH